jgi:hypothetical protein
LIKINTKFKAARYRGILSLKRGLSSYEIFKIQKIEAHYAKRGQVASDLSSRLLRFNTAF